VPVSAGCVGLRGGINPSKPREEVRKGLRPTARKERVWKQIRISGWLKALKAKAQERSRGETDPDGSAGARVGSCRRFRPLAWEGSKQHAAR